VKRATPSDHYARLVQIRVSEHAKKTISDLANQRGLSEAAFLRNLIYRQLGLAPPSSKDTP
jgi:hypothetical protein